MARKTVSVSGKPLSKPTASSGKIPRVFLFLFFGLFCLVGSILFYVFLVWPVWEFVAASSWVETPCEIISSQVTTNRSSDGDTYSAEIKFRFRYNGQEHESNRCQLIQVSTNSQGRAQRIVEKHPVGQATVCFVNPRNPSVAVLNRQLTWDFLFGLFPMIFLLIGLGGLIFTWRWGRKSRSGISSGYESFDPAASSSQWSSLAGAGRPNFSPRADQGTEDASEEDEDRDPSLPPRQPEGSRVLTPAGTPIGTFVGVLFVTLFWNGIVSAFVTIAVSAWRDGKPEWFLMVFLIPFVLVGLGLIGGTIYTLLSIFNPRPSITLLRGNLCLGDRTEIRWQFRGSTRPFRKLRISLKGTETANYRRGTKTHTDHSDFVSRPIFESEYPLEMQEGSAELEIPVNSMHTFLGTNNQITWHLLIHGDVPFWPDVSVDFPITIHPPLLDEEVPA